jgi:hypothetical protein
MGYPAGRVYQLENRSSTAAGKTALRGVLCDLIFKFDSEVNTVERRQRS